MVEISNDEAAKLVSRALQVQKRSVKAYEIIAAAAPGSKERELLLGVRREERRHYYLLEGIYEDMTGEPFAPARSALSLPRQYHDMLKTALCDKLAAIDFYEDLQEKLSCLKNQMLLELIVSDQKEHARLLAALYDQR